MSFFVILAIRSDVASDRSNVLSCFDMWSSCGSDVTVASVFVYSHLSNKRGGWNKRGGGTKNGKSKIVDVEILEVESSAFVSK